MDGVLGDPDGSSPNWGIAIEGGGKSFITENNVTNCNEGIQTTSAADSNTILNNIVYNCQIWNIYTSNNNTIESNNLYHPK